MNIQYYFVLYIIYSFWGWVFEEIVTFNKKFTNRGFLIGPYCPIHGFAALTALLILKDIQNPYKLFIFSVFIFSVIEYLTSFILEKIFKARWWDYSHISFNLNGRICLIYSLFFGLLGILLINYVNPFISDYLLLLSSKTLNIVFYILLVIFLSDIIISCKILFRIKGTIKFLKTDNTCEITEKVKEILLQILKN